MHELGIAQSILEIVRQAVPETQRTCVRTIRVRTGLLSGVVPDSLEFCFGAILSDSDMPQAGLRVEQIPATLRCRRCNSSFETDDFEFVCRSCGGSDLELVSGKELEVVDIELAEEGGQGV